VVIGNVRVYEEGSNTCLKFEVIVAVTVNIVVM
jgi:hypothetical protein